MAKKGSTQVDRAKLLNAMTNAFNEGELRTLCFELDLDYEDLPPGGKSDKARELILYCQRHNRLDDLLSLCQQKRPHIGWAAARQSGATAGDPGPVVQQEPANIFLSYSRKDSAMKERLAQDLRQAGLSVWTDDGLAPGTSSWHQAIESQLETAGCLVVLLSPDAKRSVWVRRELDYGAAQGKRIFPAMIRGTRNDAIPITIIDAQFVDLRREYDPNFARLRDALQRHLRSLQPKNTGVREPVIEKDAPTAMTQARSTEDGIVFIVTDEQARQISQTVKAIAIEVSRRSGRNEFGDVYGQLYRRFGITSYRLLPVGKFDEAIGWLTEWYDSLIEHGSQEHGLGTPPDGVAIPHIVTGAPPLNIDWCWVPAGPFTMGSDVYSREKPVHTVALDGFWLARYPLTNAQYRHFVEAGGYEQQRWWTEAGWRWRQSESVKHPGYWTDSHWNGDRQPVVGVSWYEADAFARWAAETTGEPISLPTEAQWEKAARGMDGRTYPWGNDEPTDKLCNFNGNVGKTTPIGQYSPAGDGPYGNADLAGNVWEWTGSLYKPYPYDAGDGREDAAAEGFRALRGGSWLSPRANARAASRDDVSPFDRDSYYGFRLVVRCPPSK